MWGLVSLMVIGLLYASSTVALVDAARSLKGLDLRSRLQAVAGYRPWEAVRAGSAPTAAPQPWPTSAATAALGLEQPAGPQAPPPTPTRTRAPVVIVQPSATPTSPPPVDNGQANSAPPPAEAPANPPPPPPPPPTDTAAPPPTETSAPQAVQITICHNPDKKGGKTMVVDASELPKHLEHGDTIGPCP
jgi:hypothetical protein